MNRLFFLAIFTVLLCSAPLVRADDILSSKRPVPSQTDSSRLHSNLTLPQLADLLRQWNSSCQTEILQGAVRVRLNGIISLFLLDEDRESIQYFVRFDTDTPLDRINAWNREYRYARHFVRTLDDGTRATDMEVDHLLSGGVSTKNLFQFFDLTQMLTTNFKQNLEK